MGNSARDNPPQKPAAVAPEITINGTLKSVDHIEDDGWAILTVVDAATGKPFSAVGHIHRPVVGARLVLTGRWVRDRRWARQFHFTHCEDAPPLGGAALANYAQSVLGIDTDLAERLVRRFGSSLPQVLRERHDLLTEVDGIDPRLAEALSHRWVSTRRIDHIQGLMQRLRLPPERLTTLAERLGRGADISNLILRDPYLLYVHFEDLPLSRVEALAKKLNHPRGSAHHIRALILYNLRRAAVAFGHTYVEHEELIAALRSDLRDSDLREDAPAVADAIDSLLDGGHVVRHEDRWYIAALHHAETAIAFDLQRIATAEPPFDPPRLERRRELIARISPPPLPAPLVLAAADLAAAKFGLVTGAAGTGKLRLLAALDAFFTELGARVLALAPSWAAVEAIRAFAGDRAHLLADAIGLAPIGGAARHQNHPLEADVVLVHQADRLATEDMAALLAAVPSGAVLLLSGDVHRVRPAGPGQPFIDFVQSRGFPVADLGTSPLAGEASAPERLALALLADQAPELPVDAPGQPADGLLTTPCSLNALPYILASAFEGLRGLGLDPQRDIRAYTFCSGDPTPLDTLNARIQQAVGQAEPAGRLFRQTLRRGDPLFIGAPVTPRLPAGTVVYVDRALSERRFVVLAGPHRETVTHDSLRRAFLGYVQHIARAEAARPGAALLTLYRTQGGGLNREILYTVLANAREQAAFVGDIGAFAWGVGRRQPPRRTGLADVGALVAATATRREAAAR